MRILATQRDVEGMQMRAWMAGIAVVVAIGLIWSVAAMSNLVPVDGSDSAAMSRPADNSPRVDAASRDAPRPR